VNDLKRRRRVRYSGAHPRRFEDKYKEHQADRHPETVKKILASGKTPAGTHRPVCLREMIAVLNPQPGETGLDATLGYGGHAEGLLAALLPGGKLLALDADPLELAKTEARLRGRRFGPEELVVKRLNYAGALQFICGQGLDGVDVIVADLGLSSMQIDNPQRGFSFKFDGPLDMRMNPARGEPAAGLIARWDAGEWARALEENADEPNARLLGRALTEVRARGPIQTTRQLAGAIRTALGASGGRTGSEETEKTVRRVFQAVRIAVNDEFGALETFLRNLPHCLRPGGRAAILTFHSGEDRRVKKAFLNGRSGGLYDRIAEEVIRPSAEEVRSNPRAGAAKLRWAVRSGSPTQCEPGPSIPFIA
jgi:16S rRNA (cytosine1402-N4)-methyltransferase